MDPIIEQGFSALVSQINQTGKEIQERGEAVKTREVEVIKRMIALAAPLVKEIGVILLKKGKTDTKGEIYHPLNYRKKMIALGKTDHPPVRPDDPSQTITDQFIVLSEDGSMYELMYSSDGFLVDSYLHPITPAQLLETYGYEPVFMLYRALQNYLENEEELLNALETVLMFLSSVPPKTG